MPHNFEGSLREAEMRSAVRRHLRATVSARARLVEEMGVDHGRGRADIAALDGRLTAYEIKSDWDDLSRLRHQARLFATYFDELWLVVGHRHLRSARRRLPGWWGVMTVDGQVGITIVREAAPNPKCDVRAQARLLWRNELISVLVEAGLLPDSSMRRSELRDQVIGTLDPDRLRSQIHKALSCREGWLEERDDLGEVMSGSHSPPDRVIAR